mgnify:CR=1 FL=1
MEVDPETSEIGNSIIIVSQGACVKLLEFEREKCQATVLHVEMITSNANPDMPLA